MAEDGSIVIGVHLDTGSALQDLARLEKSVGGVGDKLKSGLKTAGKVGAAAIGAATTATVAFAASSVSVGAEFDASMSQVAATMGLTVDEIGELRDFAQDMGATTAFSATQAADALNYMALAGYDSQEAMTALPNVLNLAAAGGMDLAKASDMVTDAQSALGLSMEESAELVDKMAQTASKSNTSVEQMGTAILTVGGTAKTLAGGTTELSTALGILADSGIKGQKGGTALRNVILSLSAPTDKAAKEMEALGLEVFDAQGNMRPLNDIFNDLNGTLSTMTQGEQTQVLNKIFNKTDLKSVNALLANSGERFDELSGYIDQAAGSAEKMAGTQLDNLTGDVTMFKSALEGAQIALSDQLTPSLRGMVQFGTDAIGRLSTAFQEGGLSGAMDALGTILSEGLAMVMDKLPDLIDAGMSLLGALAQGILNKLPELAKVALEIITTLASDISDSLPEIIPAVIDVILQIVETLTDPETMNNLFKASMDIMLGLADGLLKAIPKLLEALPTIVENLIAGLLDRIPLMIQAGIDLFVALVSNLPAIIAGIVKAVPQIILAILNAFGGLGDDLKNVFSGAWEPVKTVFSAVGEWFSDHVAKPIQGVWDKMADGFTSVWNGIVGTLEGAINLIIRGLNWLIDKINSISFEVPDWLGGGKVGFNLPKLKDVQIPRLAQGAVIPPNREFMAVLGDQRSGYNIEAPADLIRSIVREEVAASGMSRGPERIELVVRPESGFTRYMKFELDKETRRQGISLVQVGG